MINFTDEEIKRINEFSTELFKGSDLFKKVVTNTCILTCNSVKDVLGKKTDRELVYCRRIISYVLNQRGFSHRTISKISNCSERTIFNHINTIKLEMDIDEHVFNQVKSVLKSL